MFQYKHKPQSDDEKTVNAQFGEFFKENDPNNLFVKDAIQNSLDNGIKFGPNGEKVPVEVRITISDIDEEISPEIYNPILSPAMKHFNAGKWEGTKLPDFNLPMKYMLYEDFNTSGLEGNPLLSHLDPDKKNPFEKYNFFYYHRAAGVSGKSGEDFGRWGIGKIVYPLTSRTRTSISLTIRESDRKELLMGETQRGPHYDGNEGYRPNGYQGYGGWGKYDEGSYFCKPIDDAKVISQFKKITKMSRKNEPGLSVFIPFIINEINFPSLTYYVAEQFNLAILKGDLEVKIKFGKESITINKDTIIGAVQSVDFDLVSNTPERYIRSKEELIKNIELAKYSLSVPEEDYLRLTPYSLSDKPRWNDKKLFQDSEAIERCQELFESQNRVAVKVPIKYHLKGSEPELRWFEIFLEKDSTLKRPDGTLIRGVLNIDHINEHGKKLIDRGAVRGMILIRDPKLSSMFGDAEDVSHSRINARSSKFLEKYEDGAEAIEFVKKSLKKIIEKLHKPVQGLFHELTGDVFSIERDAITETEGQKVCEGKKKGGTVTGEPCVDPIPKGKDEIIIERYLNGVRIFGTDNLVKGMKFRVQFAFDIPLRYRQNPFKKYKSMDFDVSMYPIHIEARGASILSAVRNEIFFEVNDAEEFEILVTGFDTSNRNLKHKKEREI